MQLRCFTVCDVCDTKYWLFWSNQVPFDDFTDIFAHGKHGMLLFQLILSLLNYFQVKFWSFCPFLYKFALACSSKRDVCDMLKCPQNNNWPTADHPLRFLSRSLGLTWYQETKNGLNYLSVLLKNNKITSKRDVCDRKKQEVEVWYLVKIVFDRLCTPNFLII